jgi:hypothetical protein
LYETHLIESISKKEREGFAHCGGKKRDMDTRIVSRSSNQRIQSWGIPSLRRQEADAEAALFDLSLAHADRAATGVVGIGGK